MEQSRRDFLFRTSCAALSAAAFSSGVEHFGLISALAEQNEPDDYKALVCVFMGGGNDGNNMVVPVDFTPSPYSVYASLRSNLAIPPPGDPGGLLPITPPSIGGSTFGLHPNLSGLHTLWSQQKLAIACNVGPLVQRLTREEYRAGGPRPYQLFSHSDQVAQWQTSRSDTRSQTGWGGRVSDRTAFFNPPIPPLPMITSIAGTTVFAVGINARPLAIAPAPTALNQVLVLSGFNATPEALARRNSMDFLRTVDRQATLIRSASDVTGQTMQTMQAFGAPFEDLTTVFPNTTLGNQLRQVARVIKLNKTRPELSMNRQIFFCSFGGFDTHNNQIVGQGNLFTQLSQAMSAFYNATVELGYSDRVTTFTLSDFGRTLNPAAAGQPNVGSDHGWGNHGFIMGDAVLGGDFYGVPGLNGTAYPTLQLSGPDDTDSRGRWIPTAAVEQYAATLATWFGLPAGDIATVFPLIGRFPPGPDLGFML